MEDGTNSWFYLAENSYRHDPFACTARSSLGWLRIRAVSARTVVRKRNGISMTAHPRFIMGC